MSDVVYNTNGRDGFSIKVCHRCLLDIQNRSYLQPLSSVFLAPSAVGGTFTISATKTTKRAITRDYDDRNIPDLLGVVDDTYGRGGCTIVACHRCLFDIRSYPQGSRCLLKTFSLRAVWHTYRKGIVLDACDSSCRGHIGGPRGAMAIALTFAAFTAVFVMKDFTYACSRRAYTRC